MNPKNKAPLIDDFAARPGTARVSGHPQAARFPTVGMTLNSYNPTRATTTRRPLFVNERPEPNRWQRIKAKISWKRALITLGILVLLFAAWFGFKVFGNLFKIFGGNLFGIFNTTKLKGEDVGRVNILLAGNSADDPGHGGADLTDSIMILSLDTKNNTAFMLSIPRDLWVDIPGYGYQKINAAYVDGQTGHFSQSGYPGGGMGLLEEVVQQNFGLPIDYYALINYSALRDAVDAVGGINIKIQSCDSRGLYDPNRDWTTNGPLVDLSNGWHHLSGEQALDLARARGDPSPFGVSYGFCNSDFTRTENQRQMLLALKDKVTSAGTLANPLKLTSLFDTLGKNVRTDMKASEAHRAYDLLKKVGDTAIKSVGLNDANGKNLLTGYSAPDGESALIPAAGLNDYSQIQQLIKRLTSNDPVVKENANVVLLNASSTYGLAAANKTKLLAKNINVTATADASSTVAHTLIIDASKGKKPATLALLKGVYGPNVTTSNPYATQYPEAAFIILLGEDQSLQ